MGAEGAGRTWSCERSCGEARGKITKYQGTRLGWDCVCCLKQGVGIGGSKGSVTAVR